MPQWGNWLLDYHYLRFSTPVLYVESTPLHRWRFRRGFLEFSPTSVERWPFPGYPDGLRFHLPYPGMFDRLRFLGSPPVCKDVNFTPLGAFTIPWPYSRPD